MSTLPRAIAFPEHLLDGKITWQRCDHQKDEGEYEPERRECHRKSSEEKSRTMAGRLYLRFRTAASGSKLIVSGGIGSAFLRFREASFLSLLRGGLSLRDPAEGFLLLFYSP